jgi:hypothetical protein
MAQENESGNGDRDRLSDADSQLLAQIGEAFGSDPLPEGLLTACEGLLTWVGVDDELTQLLVASDGLVGVRADTAVDDETAATTYSVDDFTVEVIVEATAGGAVVRGTVYGDDVAEVTLEARAGSGGTDARLDDLGDFRFEGVARGIHRIRVVRPGAAAATEWFLV